MTQFFWDLWEALRMRSSTVYLKRRNWQLLFSHCLRVVLKGNLHPTLKDSILLSSAHFRPQLRENPEDKSWKMHIMCLKPRHHSERSHKEPLNTNGTVITGSRGSWQGRLKMSTAIKLFFQKNPLFFFFQACLLLKFWVQSSIKKRLSNDILDGIYVGQEGIS